MAPVLRQRASALTESEFFEGERSAVVPCVRYRAVYQCTAQAEPEGVPRRVDVLRCLEELIVLLRGLTH